jgi:hypothetical protein
MFQYFPGNYMWSLSVMRALASGANFGEVDSACSGLHEVAVVDPDGDVAAWYRAGMGLGEQVQAQATQAAQRGHAVSARNAFMRAAIYYQCAEAFLAPDDVRAPYAFDRHLAIWPPSHRVQH